MAGDGHAHRAGVLSDTPELTTIRVGTIKEKMMFDVKELNVKAGKKVRLTFANPDFMPHNLVLTQPGKADEVGMAALNLGAKGFEMNFVPESKEIIWATKLVEHDKEQVIDFTAPVKAGDYPFICSFPGHHLIMRGVMKVR